MINAFGCGFSEGYGNDFDISQLRYDKIVIMADADVDGAHISTLLLTLFFRFMPELIQEGHVYVAMPPLYKVVPQKGQEEYLYDDSALEKYRKKHANEKFTLQRYKGLGEMDADQLWETTLNPETRMLKRIEIEDGMMASEITALLMGNEVPPRREYIYKHAQDAELDIQNMNVQRTQQLCVIEDSSGRKKWKIVILFKQNTQNICRNHILITP